MLRRWALELSSSSSFSSASRKLKLLTPLSSKAHFIPRTPFSSSASPPNPSAPQQSSLPKLLLLLGGVMLGAAALAAREAGYVDIAPPWGRQAGAPPLEQLKQKDPTVETVVASSSSAGEENDANVDRPTVETVTEPASPVVNPEGDHPKTEAEPEVRSNGAGELPGGLQGGVLREDNGVPDAEVLAEDKVDSTSSVKISEPPPPEENAPKVLAESEVEVMLDERTPEEEVRDAAASEHVTSHEVPKVNNDSETQEPESLAKSYLLMEEESPEIPSKENTTTSGPSSGQEVPITDGEASGDEPRDGKILLDLIQAIHAAEKRQAESDFHIFEEEKRKIKGKYEKELKDTRVRELMYAEEAALLEKELNKEKVKAEATVKALQEMAEQKLKSELQQKEEEAELQLKKARELAKAELNAALASEKSSQMEKIAEGNLHINALCMAFYARSEEARQNHSVHKLALGALGLEEALAKGFPIQQEVETLCASLVDMKTDSLMELVLSSLPVETINNGTNTKLQLNQKFDALKGTLRHFSLIPPGGGGILTHAVASIASFIKVKENNTSGDGIESIISRVEKLLAEEKLAEAADALEQGVCGTEAEGAIREWVKQAKNRAIVEQAVTLIRSYATSVSLT